MTNAMDGTPEQLGDWRLAIAGWVREFGHVPVTEPKAYHQVTVSTTQLGQLTFRTPSAAMHLNTPGALRLVRSR